MSDDTPPPEPLSLDQAKAQLRDTPSEDDDLIRGFIVAAREYAEAYTGLILTRRTVTETAPQLGRWIDLASWPIASVDAIRYPAAGNLTDLAEGSWCASLKRRPVRLLPAAMGWGVGPSWQDCGLPVEIDLTAGFETPDDVPETVKLAMLMLISHWYANREGVEVGLRAAAVEVPFGVEALLTRWRQTLI